jgi:type I restriction enzyme M protein
MNAETHSQLANFIWSICNLLRGPYKRNEYRKVILPLTVLRRFDCLLAPTKAAVLKKHAELKGKPDTVVRSLLQKVTDRPFYNLSKLDFPKLLDDPNQLSAHLVDYMNKFSPNVRGIMEKFGFDQQIARMAEKNLLYEVIKKFSTIDLSSEHVDNVQMGYVFEELIRIGAEQSNEEAGEHFTPREVIKLMVNLLLSPEKDLRKSHVVKTIYDPACGTGGMLSVAEKYIRDLNVQANPHLFGQDWNDEAWAVCKSDMLIKGEDADNIRMDDTFTKDAFDRDEKGRKWTFDYMLANPPFGVEWKQQQRFIEREHEEQGYDGRFGAGLPRINDGSLLFLQHMLSKMRPVKKEKGEEKEGSRIAIVFNGSPLFTGDAGSGESNIRQWIIENDWLEAVVALPDQLFYNTGISTYIWVLTNRKEGRRKGKVQLIDARQFYVKMRKSLGNKRNKIGDRNEGEPDQIGDIARIHGDFRDGETRKTVIPAEAGIQSSKDLVVSRIFDNADFGFHKITVERPLRLNFQASPERIARLEEETAFKTSRPATGRAKPPAARKSPRAKRGRRSYATCCERSTARRSTRIATLFFPISRRWRPRAACA